MTDAAVAPAPVNLIRGAVLVSSYDGSHALHTVFAHVLAVGTPDENGKPTLTVAFPDPAALEQKLASPKWYEGYKRITGVKHVSHPDVQAGKESIAWGGTIGTVAELAGEGPAIPQPAGDGSRPYLKRQEPKDVSEVSKGAAIAAQGGKTPPSSTQSPLVGETDESMVNIPVSGDLGAPASATGPVAVDHNGPQEPEAGQTPEGNPTAS